MQLTWGFLMLVPLLASKPAEAGTHYQYRYPGMANDDATRRAVKKKFSSVPPECNCSACKLLPPGCDCDTCPIFPSPSPAPTPDDNTTGGGGKKDNTNPGAIAGAAAGATVGVAAAAAALRYANRPPSPIDATFEGDEGASVEEQDREVVARQESADFAG